MNHSDDTQTASPQSWSIIVFGFNESGTISEVVGNALELLANASITDFEIIIVDDGSTDGSGSIITSVQDNNDHVQAIFHDSNLGIGHALFTGYSAARYENVCAIPADGQFNVKELVPYLHIEANSFVSFYRLENTSYSIRRNVFSWFNKELNKQVFGITMKDVNWVKIYKNTWLKKFDLQLTSSLIETEICAKLLRSGVKMKEVESTYQPRSHGRSRGASWKIVWQAAGEILKLARIMRRFNS